MDHQKIGLFIAQLRREKGLTQLQLAEQLHVTNKAVSKWENGRCLPDAALFEPLCAALGITLNDLLAGEKIQEQDRERYFEQNVQALGAEYGKIARRRSVTIAFWRLPSPFCWGSSPPLDFWPLCSSRPGFLPSMA